MGKWLNQYSTEGYKASSPDRNKPFNVIPSGRITMDDVHHPVLGLDDLGHHAMMMPGREYQFPGSKVLELPLNNKEMKKMQKGGAASGHPGMFWDGEKWVSSKGGATYANGVFYATGGKYSRDGGPTFPVAGAGVMFRMGGSTASFYVDGNGYPRPFAMAPGSGQGGGMLQDLPTHMRIGGKTASFDVDGNAYPTPFAMWPGSGSGSGMLQDLPESMKKGGKHKPKMSPQQMQMMMAAMQGQGQPMGQPGMAPQGPPMQGPPQGGQPMMPPQGQPMMMKGGKPCLECGGMYMPHNINAGPYQYGGMPDNDGDVDVMKKGGHWIQKAVNPKHKGYCTPMTKSTCTPRRKAFAMTMKKHHGFHEMGGVTQGGNMVRDNEMYEMGGMHPLAKFMQLGGVKDDFDTIGQEAPAATAAPQNYASQTGVVAQAPEQNAPWTQGMNETQATQNINYGAGSTDAYDPSTGNTNREQEVNRWNRFRNGFNVVTGGIGSGLAIGAAYGNLADQRRNAMLQRSLGTSDHIAKINQPGGHGDYDQYGAFRPDQNTPTRAGIFYPGSNQPIAAGSSFGPRPGYATGFAMGGMYHQGQELEMDDAEIARLKKMGYKFEML